ncbi:MAG: hypothetical protein O3A53_15225 [Acidobacteria bacterium]|nr:hypothetical protein [Acidobacteriota bacterium]MDA1236139.1 hypothetical protein [Acidobacteriota bacterium]
MGIRVVFPVVVALLLTAKGPAADDLDADEIMSRVAANQERA